MKIKKHLFFWIFVVTAISVSLYLYYWRYTFKERFTIEPSVGIFNLFNFANFNLPPTTMSGLLTGSPGALNGTTPADNNAGFRVGNGTGVYAVGAPRQIEWGMRFTF